MPNTTLEPITDPSVLAALAGLRAGWEAHVAEVRKANEDHPEGLPGERSIDFTEDASDLMHEVAGAFGWMPMFES